MGSLENEKRDELVNVAFLDGDDAKNSSSASKEQCRKREIVGSYRWGRSTFVKNNPESKSDLASTFLVGHRWTGQIDRNPNDTPETSGGGQVWHQRSSDNLGDPKSSVISSSQMLSLLQEFTKIYADRLQRVEESAMKTSDQQYIESKVCVLESWIRDLGEQNAVLVTTVEELEKEAADRVALLEDRLAKMATTTRESCVSLRDHQIQVSSLVAHKLEMERETQSLGEKLASLERCNFHLKEENNNLQGDLNSLVQVVSRARVTGQWEADDLTFSCVTPEQIFGPVLSSSRRSSQSLKDSQGDYIHQMLEDHVKKDSSSVRSSFSNLQDGDSSIYGGRGSDKDVLIIKLKADLRCSQSANEEINCHLVERDKQIADLQAQITDLHHKLVESQTEVANVTRALQDVRCQNRRDSGEVEAQLSENIDVLANRLAELEEECHKLGDEHSALQDTHSLCAPTITMLQDQLSRSQQTQVELRTVLTAEVAERHDQVVSLKHQFKEQEQNHHETKMQLQLKNEVIKDLRKEIKEQKEKLISDAKVDTVDNGSMTDHCVSLLSDGFCPANSSQFSKLQNELAEKSILLRELQSHLASARQEVHLKDETLFKLEQKLNSSRREEGPKGERMQYLTGQLTSLQLEVGRTHGQAEHLRRQVESKNEILQKLESENSSLTKLLNEKSFSLERYQREILKVSADLEEKKKEVTEQKITISTLQDALVTSKRNCDELRLRLDDHVSVGMPPRSLPLLMYAASCSNNISDVNHCVTNKSALPDACIDSAFSGHSNPSSSLNQKCTKDKLSLLPSNGSVSFQSDHMHCSTGKQPLDWNNLPAATDMFSLPDMRTSNICANTNLNSHAVSAIDLASIPVMNDHASVMPNNYLNHGAHVTGELYCNIVHTDEKVIDDIIVNHKEYSSDIHIPNCLGKIHDV